VSSALARHVAHVRVDEGDVGRIGERDGAQWPATGDPGHGLARSYSARRTGFERMTHASLMRRISAAATSALGPSWRSG
jgi:hypothetical protein